jgi:hypothetical protein
MKVAIIEACKIGNVHNQMSISSTQLKIHQHGTGSQNIP